jgi:hypothetical protein
MIKSRAPAAKSTTANAPRLEKWEAPSNSHPRRWERHSAVQIEKRTGSVITTRGAVSPRNAPPFRLETFEGGELFACFRPLGAGYRAGGKKTDSGPDFRLTRSRHPGASGRRIGSPPGDGWAARRDPEANVRVFYDVGLYFSSTKHSIPSRQAACPKLRRRPTRRGT